MNKLLTDKKLDILSNDEMFPHSAYGVLQNAERIDNKVKTNLLPDVFTETFAETFTY
jgi:hypothetical protein